MAFRGKLYRALNPIYAREPFSGRGARLHGGRFNPKGVEALYTSLSVLTAVKEANQVGGLQPTMLVAHDAAFEVVADCRDEALLARYGFDAASLADPSWRDQMRSDGIAKTQAFALRLTEAGYDAMLVRSFAPSTSRDDLNLVVWRWEASNARRLTLIDDEGRLAQ